MGQITEQELLYDDTLSKCGIYLLEEDDETIKYNIYEQFDIGIHSFLHADSLMKLFKAELITVDKLNKSILLRDIVLELQNSDEWNFQYFRTSDRWKKIMVLSDEIKAIY